MKVKYLILFLLLTVVFSSSCSSNENNAVSSQYISSSHEELIDKNFLDPSYLKYENSTEKNEWLLDFTKDQILMENHNKSNGFSDFLLYDTKTKKYNKISESPPNIVSSGSSVKINNKYYFSEVIKSNGKDVLQIKELDYNTRKASVIRTYTEETSPFIYFSRANETDFFITHLSDDTTYIDRYHSVSKQFSRFMTSNSPDRLLAKICVYDSNIYLFVIENKKKVLEIYDTNANLIKSIHVEIPLFNGSAILKMYVIKDYIIFVNWDMEQEVYFLNGNELIEILASERNMNIITAGMSDLYQQYKGEYIFFQKRFDENNLDNTLFALQLKTRKVKAVEIKANGEYSIFCGGTINDEGDLLISMKKDYYKTSQQLFFFDNAYINNFFA